MVEFDPYSETFFEDPWETYRWLRDEHPSIWLGRASEQLPDRSLPTGSPG